MFLRRRPRDWMACVLLGTGTQRPSRKSAGPPSALIILQNLMNSKRAERRLAAHQGVLKAAGTQMNLGSTVKLTAMVTEGTS
jgi:hypothetical protein